MSLTHLHANGDGVKVFYWKICFNKISFIKWCLKNENVTYSVHVEMLILVIWVHSME